MNVLILCAGNGQRFKDVGIDTPKPLIEVDGKTILQYTLDSLPFIANKHRNNIPSVTSDSLYFAIRKEHEEYGISEYLKGLYGSDINIIEFNKLTEGSLQTAYIATRTMELDRPLLVLDCDNKYDDNEMWNTFVEIADFSHSMLVSYFDPIDDSTKWSFAITDGAIVKEIVEKDPTAIQRGGLPLIGNFWFNETETFLQLSKFIMSNKWKSGTPGKEEYYVSQVPAFHCANKGMVFAHKVLNVIPLGTPEDVEKFRNV